MQGEDQISCNCKTFTRFLCNMYMKFFTVQGCGLSSLLQMLDDGGSDSAIRVDCIYVAIRVEAAATKEIIWCESLLKAMTA